MKTFISIILFSVTFHSIGQNQSFPSIEKVITKDKLIHGEIGKYPITLYLKYQKHSYHLNVYSVKGWYYYDRYKIKIGLVGLYLYGDLVLYHFEDTSRANKIVYFKENIGNHWDNVVHYSSLQDYNEKFTFNDTLSQWTNNQKKYRFTLEQKEFDILEKRNLLRLSPTHSFDLTNILDNMYCDFEIMAYNNDRLILTYKHPSRYYSMTMCGGGTEEGLIVLEFNKSKELENYQLYTYYSCNLDIWHDQIKSNNTIIYKCKKLDELSYSLIVDLSNISVTKKR